MVSIFIRTLEPKADATGRISIYFGRNVPLLILYQDCSSHHDTSKNLADGGVGWGEGLFSLYI